MHTNMHKCAILCKFCLLLQLRIGDTRVVDGLQFLDEDRLGVGDVAEGDGALLEISLCHLCVDEAVHQFTDGFLRIVG